MADRSTVLSEEEVAAYRRDGVIVPNFRLPDDALSRLRTLTDKLIADNSQLDDGPIFCPHVPGSGVQNLKSRPGWIEFPTHPLILDMLEQVMGPNIILWGTTLFHKPASRGRIIPFHRDGRYWPIDPLKSTSVWIAIDECTPENGCLRAIPGSHKDQQVGRHYHSDRDDIAIPETLYEDEYDISEARDLELEPGQMVVFDVYTIHGSNANPSGKRRCGFSMRYMPATSFYDHHAEARGIGHDTRPLIQVRGVDTNGRNDFTTGHPTAA